MAGCPPHVFIPLGEHLLLQLFSKQKPNPQRLLHHPIQVYIQRHTCIIPFAFLSISTASIQSSSSTRPISLSKVASAPTEAVIMHLKLDPASVCVLITTRSEHSNHWVLVLMMNERVGEEPSTQTIFGDSRLPTWLPYSTDCCWNSLHQIWYI